MRITISIVWLLVLLTVGAASTQAQACGGAFAEVSVSDVKGKKIPGAIIELIAQLPRDYDNGKLFYSSQSKKISAQEAEEAVKRMPMNRTEDRCGNPLKQQADATKVSREPPFVENRKVSIEIFGFCTLETYSVPFLLKVSASGYVSEYYVGAYLGGCGSRYELVLTRKKN